MHYIIQPAVAGFSPAITAATVTADGATDRQPPTNTFNGRDSLCAYVADSDDDDAAYFE